MTSPSPNEKHTQEVATPVCGLCGKSGKNYTPFNGCANTRDAEDFAIDGDLDCLEYIVMHNAGEKGPRYVILNYIAKLRARNASSPPAAAPDVEAMAQKKANEVYYPRLDIYGRDTAQVNAARHGFIAGAVWGHHIASAAMEKKVERLEQEIEREDQSHTNTIDQRDDAEQAISQAYFTIIGYSPEWSNLFGHDDALEEIADAVSLLKQTVKPPSNPSPSPEPNLPPATP